MQCDYGTSCPNPSTFVVFYFRNINLENLFEEAMPYETRCMCTSHADRTKILAQIMPDVTIHFVKSDTVPDPKTIAGLLLAEEMKQNTMANCAQFGHRYTGNGCAHCGYVPSLCP